MLAGKATGALADLTPLKVAIIPLTMLMVYPALVTFSSRRR
jgi:hypothetical protein